MLYLLHATKATATSPSGEPTGTITVPLGIFDTRAQAESEALRVAPSAHPRIDVIDMRGVKQR